MSTTKQLLRFLLFIFKPLLFKGRWFIWLLTFLLLIMFGNTITAIRMEIPNLEDVNRVTGKFADTGKGYGKGVLFDIGIVDASGRIHKCNCEPLAYSNCLGRNPSDHKEILDQLDAEVLKKHALQKAIVKWLDGRDGEVWMHPNRSFFGSPNSCYQISTNTYILRSYEQSVQEYSKAKSGIDVYILWLIAPSGILFLLIFVIVRISTFKRVENGQPRS